MKKILWLTESWSYDTDKEIVPYLIDKMHYDIKWVVITNKKAAPLPHNEFCEIKIRPYCSVDPRCYFFYKEIFKEAGIGDYDLIYSSFHGFPYYILSLFSSKRKQTKVVHAAHNVIPYAVWTLRLRLAVKMEFAMYSYFQMFSKSTAKWFSEHYPQKSWFYSPMTVKDFGPVNTSNYEVDSSKVNLLFFGNVVGNKRLDLLVDAVKHLPEEIRERVHLNICGNCRMDKDTFIKQIGDCNAISYHFRRIPDEEIPELFTKHQFLMLPYEDVAQSGPHMIAYNYNLPVIASDIDGFKERIIDGENGFLFSRNDEESLKEKISIAVMMTQKQYKDMRDNLRRYVADNYSLPVVAKRYIDYFNSITKDEN